MEDSIKTYVYHLTSQDPSITDKYIGYTTKYYEMIDRWYDDNAKQPQYIEFIKSHGGLETWNIQVLKICVSRDEAEVEKLLHMTVDPTYTLNKRGLPHADKKSRSGSYYFGVMRKRGLKT
jgi:hypothetical protein